MRREHVSNALLVVAAGLVGYVCYLMASPFLVPIAWAAVLAIVVRPLHCWVERRIGRKGTIPTVLTVLLVFFLVLLPLVGLGYGVTREVLRLLPSANSTDQDLGAWAQQEVQVVNAWLAANFGVQDALSGVDLGQTVQTIAGYLFSQTQSIVGGVVGFLLRLVIVIFTLFFFLRDREAIVQALREFLPLTEHNADDVFERVRNVIMASVIGGGAVALAQALLAGLAFWLLGVRSSLLWAVATFFCSFIPVVGAAAVWVPVALGFVINGDLLRAMVLLLYGAFVISLVDNFLRPIVIGDRTQLHTLLIFFSIMGGLQVFGFVGIIMGPVVLAVGLALVEVFKRTVAEHEVGQPGNSS
jgi:predicted PurR-regulated permease PerM